MRIYGPNGTTLGSPASNTRRTSSTGFSLPDAPATVPHPGEGIEPSGSQPPEDGGVQQHPIHDSDVEDLGPEDFEHLTDEIEKTGIKSGD